MVARSSGAPTGRGAALQQQYRARRSDHSEIEPSTRGAPGAFGCSAGSNASDRRPLGAAVIGGAAIDATFAGGRRQVRAGAPWWPRAAAGAQRLEPGFIVLLHALERRLELLIAELCLLDQAGELPHLIFELVDPHQEVAGRLGTRGNATGYDGDDRYGGNSETGHYCSHLDCGEAQ